MGMDGTMFENVGYDEAGLRCRDRYTINFRGEDSFMRMRCVCYFSQIGQFVCGRIESCLSINFELFEFYVNAIKRE